MSRFKEILEYIVNEFFKYLKIYIKVWMITFILIMLLFLGIDSITSMFRGN